MCYQLSVSLCFEWRHVYISFHCFASGCCFDYQQYQAGSKVVEEVFKLAGWQWKDSVLSCLVLSALSSLHRPGK